MSRRMQAMGPESIRDSGTVSVPLTEVSIRVSRSSGPGGQHANTSETRVEARFDVAASATLTDAQKRRVVARVGPGVRTIAQGERRQLRDRGLALGGRGTRRRGGVRLGRRGTAAAPR